MEIGSRIRFFRIQKNMTQEELAHEIISISYLSKIENNQTSASIEVLELLCERLGIKLIESEEYEQLRELHDWYHLMVARKREPVIAFYESYESKNTNDSRVAIFFVLFELRYFIFIKQLDKAEAQIKKIELYKDIFDIRMNYFYEKIVGQFYYFKSQFSIAMEHFKVAEEILTSSVHFESWETADLYYYKGLNHNRLGKLALSIVYIQKALAIYQSLYDLKRSAECQILLGISYEKINEFEMAEENYLLATKVAEGINDPSLLGLIYHNQAVLYSKLGKSTLAIEQYRKSLEHKEEQMVAGRLRSIHGLIEEYHKIEDYDNCKKWLHEGFSIVEKHQDLTEFNIHFIYYDYLLQNSENLVKFIEKDALSYFEGIEHHLYIAYYAEKLGKIYQENHKYKLASYFFSKAISSLKKHSHLYQ
ncbi:helix-turn-helix transcriptional regulator [Fredinandcohnia sp. QZ13]|uniref:helix-turn-helix domain-containing protein n=1 Tax=Fredinandcohnia sp. QZ13 TaxID=3073144 RepID=UPI0028532BD4|nr:helix-turn-helix transcriptional regulator [Fredinandcohnia sp. QZ13]MDR4886949.1 helix-turn-helix transcriptional regulator [Fredinandcohnia sp. QZ13]